MLTIYPKAEQAERLHGFAIVSWRGLSEDDRARHLRQQIIEKSRQQHIADNTTDLDRFASVPAFLEWAKQGRILYCLTHETLDLAGLIYFGKKEHEQARADVTFAIRMYEGYAGKGLARPFMQAAHEHVHHHYFPNTPGFWLETDQSNDAALHLYRTFGYTALHNDESSSRVVMEYAVT